MSQKDHTSNLLIRYLDGTLAEDEQERAEAWLREDAEARLMLRTLAEQAVVAADVERAKNDSAPQVSYASGVDQRLWDRSWHWVLATVAAVGLIAIVVRQAVFVSDAEHPLMTVVALNGPFEWTGDAGRVSSEIKVGDRLPGGTMQMLAPDAWAEFEFPDQSSVTLTGLSAVTISAVTTSGGKQKQLYLRHGNLSANVQPQLVGHPMLVKTPSAELQVLGTKFDVEAVSELTRLTVNEGRVRLKRLIDGNEVDVPALQTVTASLEDQSVLAPFGHQAPVTQWQSDLRADVVKGKWFSSHWRLGVALKKSVRSGEMTEEAAQAAFKDAVSLADAAGGVWSLPSPYGSLVVLSPLNSLQQPLRLNANTKMRVRVRVTSSTSLRIGFSVYHANGGFAGKYSTVVTLEQQSNAKDDGDVVISLPISRFHDERNSAEAAVGNDLMDWWCVAEGSSAKVEIVQLEMTDGI
ncbi:MAG: FecR domain-containing protein [Rubripirellula sp.]|nr:FecR domain-containing protein [Rubripirellula sp.]